MSLLLRLYDTDSGSIFVGGQNIRDLKLASLRSNVAISLQENLLFGTSIRENIRYAVPTASDAEITNAAKIAEAHEFILEQPHGYDTELGERGAKLSSGQRQRLSIARGIIKNTPILILDEPTAALDAVTENKVMANLVNWGKDRVIFVITHRISTIRQANQIMYVRDGHIQEMGTHSELMIRDKGAYRNFVELEESLMRMPVKETA